MSKLKTQPREDTDISVLFHDKKAQAVMHGAGRVHSFTSSEDIDINHTHNIFVISNAMGLGEVADFVRQANDSKRLRGLLIRQDNYQNWITQLLEKANLRTLRNTIVHSGVEVPQRILKAWEYEAQHQLIADAAVLDDRLFVLDCALNRYEIGFDQIKALAKIPKADRHNFTISEEGSHISWDKYDVDVDLDSLHAAIDPNWRCKTQIKKMQHDHNFGTAISKFRQKKNLKQTEVPGLTDRQVRRIEAGEQHATLKSLELLAAAHGMKLNAYLNKVVKYVEGVDNE